MRSHLNIPTLFILWKLIQTLNINKLRKGRVDLKLFGNVECDDDYMNNMLSSWVGILFFI